MSTSSAIRFQPLPIGTAREVFPQAARPVSFIERVMCRVRWEPLSRNTPCPGQSLDRPVPVQSEDVIVACPANLVPVRMRHTGTSGGPGKAVPFRRLVLGLLRLIPSSSCPPTLRMPRVALRLLPPCLTASASSSLRSSGFSECATSKRGGDRRLVCVTT